MSTQLFYFSGTGNSLELARDIAKKLDDTKLVSVPSVLGRDFELEADTVGLIFPVYAWGVPRIIIDFVNQLKFKGDEYVFAIVTCGGNPAGTLPQLAKLLQTGGIELKAGFAVVQPDNYIPWHGAIAEEKQARLFALKEKRLPDIIEVIRNKKTEPLEQNSAIVNFALGLVYKISIKHFSSSDKNFWVADSCWHCGHCERLCPRGNISSNGDRIRWNHNCEMCLACIQWCPRQAIQYGKKTVKRKRYHHPGVTIQDLFQR